jgi:hypothetical protein
VVDLVDEPGEELLAISFLNIILMPQEPAVIDCWYNDASSTHDSTPRTSHTLHASFRFFLYAWPIELT